MIVDQALTRENPGAHVSDQGEPWTMIRMIFQNTWVNTSEPDENQALTCKNPEEPEQNPTPAHLEHEPTGPLGPGVFRVPAQVCSQKGSRT